MNLDFVFICQSGELEIKASLLAASIRRFCDSKANIHIIEPSPQDVYGSVSKEVREFLINLGAIWYSLKNPISDDYKIGNKLNAFKIDAEGDRIVFLDSDTIFLKEFKGFEHFFCKDFAAKGSDGQTFDSIIRRGWDWNNVYDLFGIPYPRMMWPAQKNDEWGPPYFNAGFLVANPKLDLSTHWIETCLKIKECKTIKNKYPWLDQVALAISIIRKNIDYQLLSDLFNFPLHIVPLPANKKPYIIHYHFPKVITNNPQIHKTVYEIINEYKISEILCLNDKWLSVIEKSFTQPIKRTVTHLKEIKREFFITGIPRSGTSLLCSLLDNLPNVAILNEPNEVFRDLRIPQFSIPFNKTISTWRQKIVEGKEIENKMQEGKVSENTFRDDGTNPLGMNYENYSAKVDNEYFALGIKNPLVFLTRLKDIRKAYPNALIINMVRHPYYTIGSWIRTFIHLREVWLHDSLLHGFNSPVINKTEKIKLMQLPEINDLSIRRAGFWNYLASIDLSEDDPLYIRLKYEDLINDPEYWIRKIYGILFPGDENKLKLDIQLSSRNESKHYHISDWQKKCIQAICINHMDSLGYDI